MKKIYLLAIAATLTSAAFSQVKLGGQLTGTLSSASFITEEEITSKKTPLAGLGIGLSAELSLSQTLSLRSSLGLLQKGVTIKTSSEEAGTIGKIEGKFTNKLYYAELPVHLTFNKEALCGKVFAGAGPSIGYGLFGKSKANYTVITPGMPTHTENESVDVFKKGDDGGGFKRLDMSASFIAGLQFNSGLYVNAGYLLGLSNALPKSDGDSYKNRGLQLTIGMFLKGK